MANTIIDGLKERISKASKINQSVGIIVPGTNYSDLLDALFSHMMSNDSDAWAYVSITKPFSTLTKKYSNIADHKNISFIDCISHAAGIPASEENCIFVESPTMLEKLSMEIMNVFRDVKSDANRFLVIDSLSSLMIYNDAPTVTEFFYHLINRTRSGDIHSISLVVEEEEMDKHLSKIIFLNDKILKVRDSFI